MEKDHLECFNRTLHKSTRMMDITCGFMKALSSSSTFMQLCWWRPSLLLSCSLFGRHSCDWVYGISALRSSVYWVYSLASPLSVLSFTSLPSLSFLVAFGFSPICLKTSASLRASYLCGDGTNQQARRRKTKPLQRHRHQLLLPLLLPRPTRKSNITIPLDLCAFQLFFLPSIMSSSIDLTLCCVLISLGSLVTLERGTLNLNRFHFPVSHIFLFSSPFLRKKII